MADSQFPKYNDYRNRFIRESTKANLQILSIKIEGQDLDSNPLYQDYAFLDRKQKITTVIMSGLHGAEGYIGSDIQDELIKNISNSSIQTNLLFVHAVNLYGMAWYRRTNQNNVDLNRNAAFSTKKIENNKFSIFLPFLSSSSIFELILQWPLALVKALALGARDTSQIIASGQYEYQKSIFFGGFETEKEVSNLLSTIQKLAPNTETFRVIDIHTGLGPSAFDSLLVSGDSRTEIQYFEKILEPKHLMILSKDPKYYKANGLLEDAFRAKFGIENVHYVTQEFGTLPFYKVLSCLILENSWFYQGRQHDKKRFQLSLDTFYPKEPNWKTQCIQAGIKLFSKVVSTQ